MVRQNLSRNQQEDCGGHERDALGAHHSPLSFSLNSGPLYPAIKIVAMKELKANICTCRFWTKEASGIFSRVADPNAARLVVTFSAD